MQPLVRVRIEGLSKRYGTNLANDRVDLTLAAGAIVGLIGENGAGKSTLMKALYGLVRPDAGRILIDGVERRWRSPAEAIATGIGMVQQHFMLVPEYSVLENIVLGVEPVRRLPWPKALRPIDRQSARRDIEALARQYGLEVPLDALCGSLPVGLQQRVEILKTLYRRANVLILDEPTAVLTPLETSELFANLRRLAAEGCAVVIITHKLSEVRALCDTVTVMRAGRVVGQADPKAVTEHQLATMMVGKDLNLKMPERSFHEFGETVLEMREVTHRNRKLQQFNLQVRAGEIIGIAGVEGNGQSEVVEAILSPAMIIEGQLRLFGRDGRGFKPRQVRALGIGMIPEDRHQQGLLLNATASDNCLLGFEAHPTLSRLGFLRLPAVRRHAQKVFENWDVRPRILEQPAAAFSGGNQQKLIIGRELEFAPGLIVASCPTRGVDVGAIEQIHRRLMEARDRGAAILLISSDLDEILALSDSILVLYSGRVAAQFNRSAVDITRLGLAMGGASDHKASVRTGGAQHV